MKEKIRALANAAKHWLNNTNEGTWVGHWLQGLAGFWLGYLPMVWATDLPTAASISAGVLAGFLVVALVFAHREGDNMLDGIRKYGARLAIRKKGLDGIMDWIMPALACFADIQIVTGSFSDLVAALVGTAAVWLMAFLVERTR